MFSIKLEIVGGLYTLNLCIILYILIRLKSKQIRNLKNDNNKGIMSKSDL